MKEFYGEVSFTGNIGYLIKAKDENEAKDIVFNDIEGIEITLKDGSKLEISEVNWDLISESSRGNVAPPYVDGFWIEEEK